MIRLNGYGDNNSPNGYGVGSDGGGGFIVCRGEGSGRGEGCGPFGDSLRQYDQGVLSNDDPPEPPAHFEIQREPERPQSAGARAGDGAHNQGA